MKIKIVNRKYIIKKLIRFEKMVGVKLLGYKLAIGKYEIRLYYASKKDS